MRASVRGANDETLPFHDYIAYLHFVEGHLQVGRLAGAAPRR